MHGNVRQCGGTVTAYTGTSKHVNTHVEILGSRHANVGKEAAASLGIVGRTGSRSARRSGGSREVRVVAITEPAGESADFKMTILPVISALDDEVRGDV